MMYRITATVLLLLALGALAALYEGNESPPTSEPATTSVDPDASAMKSLRIE